jgi:lysozyme
MDRRIANIALFLAVAAIIILVSGCERPKSSGALPKPQAAAGTSLPTVEMPTLTPAAPSPATATPQTLAPTAVPPTSPPPVSAPAGGTPPTPTSMPVTSTPGRHIVRPGEWLFSIGRLYNVNPFTLAQVNGIYPPYRIYPGQQLIIPGGAPGPTPVPGTCASPYTVQRGDTVYSIARRCGKTPSAIITANNLINPNYIFVGQKLQIP